MTSVQIISDLHIEFKSNVVPDPLDFVTPVSDILVMAGDIGSLYKLEQLKGFLQRLCVYFKTVLYVPGNHEYYMIDKMKPLNMKFLFNRLYYLEKNISNLFILNRKSFRIGDTCIVGCTLWSKLDIQLPKYIVKINKINTKLYNYNFHSDLNYIHKMIDYCQIKKIKLVVVTHYCPTYKVLLNTRKKKKFYSLYSSNLDELLSSKKIDTWICGHNHSNFDYVTPLGTRLVSNQKGKPKDKIENFSKNFKIFI